MTKHNAVRSLCLLYLFNGMVFSTWGIFIPYFKQFHGINDAALSMAMFSMSAGAILVMGRAGRLVNAIGTRKSLIIFSVLYPLMLLLLFLSPSFYLACGFMLLFGMSLAVLDVAMNVEATALEKHLNRPILSTIHGMFSLGGIVGSLSGLLAQALGLKPLPYVILMMLLIALFSQWLSRNLRGVTRVEQGEEIVHVAMLKQPLRLWLVGILAFLALFSEGAMYDWSTVYIKEILRPDPHYNYLGYALFSTGMTLGRLTGDRLRKRAGDAKLLTVMACVGVLGIALILLVNSLGLSLVGFFLLGLGLANMMPLLFMAAAKGDSPNTSASIAMVTRLAYAGMLTGPVIIGGISVHFGLQAALWVISATLALIALTGGRLMR